MRLLGRGACRNSVWCTAVQSTPATAARPRPRPRPRQPADNEPCSRPEPLLVCLPVLEEREHDTSSSSSSSSSSPVSSSCSSRSSIWSANGSVPAAVALWQFCYRGGGGSVAPLHPLLPLPLSFVEVQDAPQLSVQLDEQPPQQREQQQQPDQKHKDYYANVGDCIRTLREDIPLLFHKDLNYSIYREDMVFKDPRVSFKGLKNYKLVIWSLRFHGNLFFKRPYVEVLRIWQPEDNIIKMRWAVHGCPRLWWTQHSQFDGVSTYKLDKNGAIYEHGIDNMQLRDPPITNPLLYGWNMIAQPLVPAGQTPCPGAGSWFLEETEDTLPSSVVSAGQQ